MRPRKTSHQAIGQADLTGVPEREKNDSEQAMFANPLKRVANA